LRYRPTENQAADFFDLDLQTAFKIAQTNGEVSEFIKKGGVRSCRLGSCRVFSDHVFANRCLVFNFATPKCLIEPNIETILKKWLERHPEYLVVMSWRDWYDSLWKPSWTPEPATIGLIWQIIFSIN
jgi:hypothetical protein